MSAAGVFSKLQLKDQPAIAVLNAPQSFEKELRSLKNVLVNRALTQASGFNLAFLTTRAELKRFAAALARHAGGDAAVWVAYPKGSSRRYQSELGRDKGCWQPLGDLGYEPVRMIAIDEDWSALRFRRAEFIKSLTRGAEHALSKVGKSKADKRA